MALRTARLFSVHRRANTRLRRWCDYPVGTPLPRTCSGVPTSDTFRPSERFEVPTSDTFCNPEHRMRKYHKANPEQKPSPAAGQVHFSAHRHANTRPRCCSTEGESCLRGQCHGGVLSDTVLLHKAMVSLSTGHSCPSKYFLNRFNESNFHCTTTKLDVRAA